MVFKFQSFTSKFGETKRVFVCVITLAIFSSQNRFGNYQFDIRAISVCLSVCLYFCVFVSLSSVLFVYPFLLLSVCLSVSLSVSPSFCLSVYICVYLYLSLILSAYLSLPLTCLSVFSFYILSFFVLLLCLSLSLDYYPPCKFNGSFCKGKFVE